MSTKNMTKKQANKLGYEFILLSDKTYQLIDVPKNIKEAYIPETYEGKNVTSIGKIAFVDCSQ